MAAKGKAEDVAESDFCFAPKVFGEEDDYGSVSEEDSEIKRPAYCADDKRESEGPDEKVDGADVVDEEHALKSMTRLFSQLLAETDEGALPEFTSEMICKHINSPHALIVQQACITLCRRICSARPLDPSQLPLAPVLRDLKRVWFRARRQFAAVLRDARISSSPELDISECIWQAYACANIAYDLATGDKDLPAVRGRSYMAGQILRASMDERAFKAIYRTREPRPKIEDVLLTSRVVACAANVPEAGDVTLFTDTEFALRNGVVKLCESFADLKEVSTLRFCKLASRFSLAIERAEAYLSARLVFRSNDAVLARKVKSVRDLVGMEQVKLLLESSVPAAIQLSNKLCLPLMALEDALMRMHAESGAVVDPATVLGQSLGIRKANALRKEGKRDGVEVVGDPASPCHDAWMLIAFDRLVAGSTDFSIVKLCLLLDHEWHGQYARLHSKHDDNRQCASLPFVLRIANRWYVSVAANLDKLPKEALIQLPGKQISPNSTVLIQCGDINACLSLWYLIVSVAFGGDLGANASLSSVKSLFSYQHERR